MKGVPQYFSRLLGVTPKGMPPLRAPRPVFAPAVDAADALSLNRPERARQSAAEVPADRRAKGLRTEAAPPVLRSAVPHESPASPEASPRPAPPVNLGDSISVSRPRWPDPLANLQPSPGSPLSEHSSARPDTASAQNASEPVQSPLDSMLQRAAERFLGDPPRVAIPAPVSPQVSSSDTEPRKHRYPAPLVNVPASAAPDRSLANTPSTASGAARPAIEIGNIEVRIHPAAALVPKPAVKGGARATSAGTLTRIRYLHGFRQG